jgi:threonine aldolase
MYSFKNDYSELGHPRILAALSAIAGVQHEGYGLDKVSAEAKELIASVFACEAEAIHFLCGGTQANLVMINAALRPTDAIVAPVTAHINVHEAGAVEHNGNKILPAPSVDGKITAPDIAKIIAVNCDEHTVVPRLVFVSQPTECGTVYSKAELTAIWQFCQKNGLLLHIDGARLGCALMAEGNDVAARDYATLCDSFYIGGTKLGSPLGEALVIVNKELRRNFRNFLKLHGAMLAKGALIGACFKELFRDGLYFENGKLANAHAQRIAAALVNLGYEMYANSPTNQIFPILTKKKATELRGEFDFADWVELDEEKVAVRFVTSYCTDETQVDRLIGMM